MVYMEYQVHLGLRHFHHGKPANWERSVDVKRSHWLWGEESPQPTAHKCETESSISKVCVFLTVFFIILLIQ